MRQRTLLHAIVFLSGLAGLGYEIVWARMLSVGLGHEIPAVLAVMAALFSGLAVGSWVAGRRCGHAPRLARLYAFIELAIGCWSLASVPLISWVNGLVATWIGPMPSALRQWAVAFLVPLVLLFPATAAMGATLPVVARIADRLGTVTRPVAGLYAANTFGAVAGTMLTTWLVVPLLGYRAALCGLAGANFVCAAAALRLGGSADAAAPPPAARAPIAASGWPGALAMTLFLTGLLGVGYEVLVVRLLSQVLESTVYSFASALVVYLLGTAAGAALYHRLGNRLDERRALSLLLTALSTACVAGVAALRLSDSLLRACTGALGRSLAASIAAEMIVAAAAFLLPTAAMGATFSHLAERARSQPLGFGGALCVNTLGSALAPLAFGVVALPLLGPTVGLAICSLGYLLLIPLSGARVSRGALVPFAAAAAVFVVPGPLRLITLDPGETVAAHVDGVMAAVTILRDGNGDFHLKVNNRFQMGGTSSAYSDLRQGHLPLLLHPNPGRALYLGLGTGATFAAAVDHPGLHADGVELVPEIIPLLPYFRKSTGDLSSRENLSVIVADARRYVRASRERYDVVVADLFHPARDGAGSLYTREHFAAIRARLEEGGLFCQWLPLYQLDLETLRTITRTFLDVFPDGRAYLAHYSLKSPIVGLVGGAGGMTYAPGWLERRVGKDGPLAAKLARIRLSDDYALLGGYLAGSDALRRFAGEGPLNTDDRPRVAFDAPRFAYAPAEPAQDRLIQLVQDLGATPEELLGGASTDADREPRDRLAAFWSARNHFLVAGTRVRETSDPRWLLAQVRAPLLDVVRESPDFDAAYHPLVALAARLRREDPAEAERLLADLERARRYRGASREPAAAGPLGGR
jgi:spermidine synthase